MITFPDLAALLTLLYPFAVMWLVVVILWELWRFLCLCNRHFSREWEGRR